MTTKGWILTVVGSALVLSACQKTSAGVGQPDAVDALPIVPVAKVSRTRMASDIVLTGEFEPFQQVDVLAKVAGYVRKISVDIGDRVDEGQTLALLEIPEMDDDLTRAAAVIDETGADIATASEELRRAEAAHQLTHLSYQRIAGVVKQEPGLVPQQEVDQAQSRDLVSEAQVAAARSELQRAQQKTRVARADQARLQTLHKYTKITAPFNGIVTKRYANEGSMIQSGTASQTQAMPVVQLSQNTLLRLILSVPESAVSRVHVGDAVDVRVTSLNRSFPGKVARLADKIQPATRTMDTEVDVPNPSLTLIPGMYAEVNLRVEEHRNALAVPLGMPPEQVEGNITYHLERFFTLASGIEHMESRSLAGVSLIKVYFQPGTNPDSAVTTIASLAMAEISHLPPGTLPPFVLKMDASTLPVCLVTFRGQDLSETQLKDLAQNVVRNQLAGVAGAAVPQPFSGRWREIMLYADPFKLESRQLSLMDVVRAMNESNLILPAGDVQIGKYDYNIYANSQVAKVDDIGKVPVKVLGANPVRVADIGTVKDAYALQYNAVRVDGQRSVYLPVLKQGGDSNTIAVVDGVRDKLKHLFDVPPSLQNRGVFDQSQFVKTAIHTLLDEGGIGLLLTSVMILVFLGSMRATAAVFFSIPLSALATFVALQLGGGSINTMVLGGLALALSRLIDNSVVVLENIYRHLERGDPAVVAAEKGGREVALPVLAATLTTVVVFFPVTMLYGVSKFLFSSLALAVVLSLFASYAVAMTVVPLFCANFLKHSTESSGGFNAWFNRGFERLLDGYSALLRIVLLRPAAWLILFAVGFGASLLLFPRLELAFFPRTDAGKFVINVKAPSGTRLVETEKEIARLEDLLHRTIPPSELGMIVSNIGVDPGFSAIYTSNSAMHTAFLQVSLKPGHRTGSFEYMALVKERMRREMPELSPYFASGSLIDAVLNMGLAAERISRRVTKLRWTYPGGFARSPAWRTLSFRRTWTIRQSSSRSIAPAPANWG